MPKRTAQEKIAKYEAKIKKLMSAHTRHSSRVIYSEDDENPIEEQIETHLVGENEDPAYCEGSFNIMEETQAQPEPEPAPQEDTVLCTSGQSTSPMEKDDLDPELLHALGESTSDAPDFGPSIHESLASLWQPILKKGLPDDNRDTVVKSYPIPENCKLLLAPKLNAEISSAIPNIARGRDKKLLTLQQQLGTGISAVNKGMDTLLKSGNKVETLKSLSDSCRMLSDLHYSLSKYRIKLITPSLDKNFLHVLQDSQRDELLFGSELGEKIKASKAIEKQGQQIKKSAPIQKPAVVPSTVVRPAYIPPGNWNAPPHYPSSTRGGRGGARRQLPAAAYRKPQTNAAYNKSTQPKNRTSSHH